MSAKRGLSQISSDAQLFGAFDNARAVPVGGYAGVPAEYNGRYLGAGLTFGKGYGLNFGGAPSSWTATGANTFEDAQGNAGFRYGAGPVMKIGGPTWRKLITNFGRNGYNAEEATAALIAGAQNEPTATVLARAAGGAQQLQGALSSPAAARAFANALQAHGRGQTSVMGDIARAYQPDQARRQAGYYASARNLLTNVDQLDGVADSAASRLAKSDAIIAAYQNGQLSGAARYKPGMRAGYQRRGASANRPQEGAYGALRLVAPRSARSAGKCYVEATGPGVHGGLRVRKGTTGYGGKANPRNSTICVQSSIRNLAGQRLTNQLRKRTGNQSATLAQYFGARDGAAAADVAAYQQAYAQAQPFWGTAAAQGLNKSRAKRGVRQYKANQQRLA